METNKKTDLNNASQNGNNEKLKVAELFAEMRLLQREILGLEDSFCFLGCGRNWYKKRIAKKLARLEEINQQLLDNPNDTLENVNTELDLLRSRVKRVY